MYSGFIYSGCADFFGFSTADPKANLQFILEWFYWFSGECKHSCCFKYCVKWKFTLSILNACFWACCEHFIRKNISVFYFFLKKVITRTKFFFFNLFQSDMEETICRYINYIVNLITVFIFYWKLVSFSVEQNKWNQIFKLFYIHLNIFNKSQC